jgi:RNA polymerase sigma-70 factor (ECF subfamily)
VSPADDADRTAHFEALVTTAYEPLQRYLRRRTDPASADDVLGDVLLVMWRRLDEIPAEAELAWCYGVARGCLANSVRADRRRLRLVNRLAREPVYAPTPPSADVDLDGALASMRPADREVLHLWAWEGLAPREMAVVLGITPNAASIRLHRATQRLRAGLGDGKDRGSPGQPGGRERKEASR